MAFSSESVRFRGSQPSRQTLRSISQPWDVSRSEWIGNFSRICLPRGAFGAINSKSFSTTIGIHVDSRVNYLLLATALLGTFFRHGDAQSSVISMPTVAQSLGTDLLGVSWALLVISAFEHWLIGNIWPHL